MALCINRTLLCTHYHTVYGFYCVRIIQRTNWPLQLFLKLRLYYVWCTQYFMLQILDCLRLNTVKHHLEVRLFCLFIFQVTVILSVWQSYGMLPYEKWTEQYNMLLYWWTHWRHYSSFKTLSITMLYSSVCTYHCVELSWPMTLEQ